MSCSELTIDMNCSHSPAHFNLSPGLCPALPCPAHVISCSKGCREGVFYTPVMCVLRCISGLWRELFVALSPVRSFIFFQTVLVFDSILIEDRKTCRNLLTNNSAHPPSKLCDYMQLKLSYPWPSLPKNPNSRLLEVSKGSVNILERWYRDGMFALHAASAGTITGTIYTIPKPRQGLWAQSKDNPEYCQNYT